MSTWYNINDWRCTCYNKDIIQLLIDNFLGYFSLISQWYCQYQPTDFDTENDQSVWHQTRYDITNKKRMVLKVSNYIITVCPIGLTAMLAIMSVSTFVSAIILYILNC